MGAGSATGAGAATGTATATENRLQSPRRLEVKLVAPFMIVGFVAVVWLLRPRLVSIQ